MNILIDTNIFIYFEDYKIVDESFTKFYNLCSNFDHKLFIHPYSIKDINNDKNEERRKISLSKIEKYPLVENPPIPSQDDLVQLNLRENNRHDMIDNVILYALYKNVVNLLITEDIGIIKKSRQLGIDHRVMYVQQALHSFNKLHLQYEVRYPEMTKKYLYELNKDDEIFDSLRTDYEEFNEWFNKASSEHRQCWIHGYQNDEKLGGILIYKDEFNEVITNCNKGLKGKILKISTFKIAEHMQGLKLGELFIKTIFDYAFKNRYEHIYLTTKDNKQPYLINLIEDFGFSYYGICTRNRDGVYVKSIPFNQNLDMNLSTIEFHKQYAPFIKCTIEVKKFMIPIQPNYHNVLFPEIEDTKRLFYTNPSAGNTIKKAYISHSKINKMKQGDLVLFYRSNDKKAITTLGIVEKSFKSKELNTILEEVTKRTVYSYEEIKKMSKKETNIILFRLVGHFDAPFIGSTWMKEEKMYRNCQSICEIDDISFSKILKHGKLSYCRESLSDEK